MKTLRLVVVGVLMGALAWAVWGQGPWAKAIPPDRAHPRLEGELQWLAEQAAIGPLFALQLAAQRGLELSNERVGVVVEAASLNEAWVHALGGYLGHAAPEFGLWEVWIPLERVVDLAELPGVRYVRRPLRPQTLVTSEGVTLTGAQGWHTVGRQGQGIRVAVIDLEFHGLSQALARGELRNVVAVRDYTGQGMESGGAHGVACAEIVHDMAPQAELVLMKVDNEVQLAVAVRDALALGVHIISHSAAWFNTNFYDGTGIVCEIVRTATDRGVLWVNAVGNSADGAHWEGAWQDHDEDGLLDFAPGIDVNTFQIQTLNPIGLWLTWDDWPTTDQDYDLYLVQLPAGTVVASSTATQAGAQPPVEQIVYQPLFPGTYGVVVQAYHAPRAPRLELFCTTNVKLGVGTAQSSVPAPADASFVLSVGALDMTRWATGPQQPYSSQGPTNTSRLNPTALVKPDLMGPDGVSTWSYGTREFLGTSASAPHVAGAAALVWSLHPTWSAIQVRTWLEGNAIDMGAAGKDNTYGHGRLNLPLSETPPPLPPPGAASHTYGPVAGWYMVSVPTHGDSAEAFGTTLYQWNGSAYARATLLQPVQGYWAWLPVSKTVTAAGTVPTSDQTLTLHRAGWHQISVPWLYPKSAIRVGRGTEVYSWSEAVARGWVRDSLYGYRADQGSYAQADLLHPWYGYWLYAGVTGLQLMFSYAARVTGEATWAYALSSEVHGSSDLPPPPADEPPGDSPPVRIAISTTPTRGTGPMTFSVRGVSASSLVEFGVRVLDFAGNLLWESSTQEVELSWMLEDFKGQKLANGVYLVYIWVRLHNGTSFSEIYRLGIYR